MKENGKIGVNDAGANASSSERLPDDVDKVGDVVQRNTEHLAAASQRGLMDDTAVEPQHVRMAEALLFAASQPLSDEEIAEALPAEADVTAVMKALAEKYADAGVNVVRVAGRWQMRTAEDLRHLLRKEEIQTRRLSRAALETLAIIAYHQPVTRAEIEDIRGVSTSKGVLDALMETGWVRIRGRRRVPGRPVTYGTTDAFLEHFGLESIADLPGLGELKAAGLLDASLPPDFTMPVPSPQDEALDPEADDSLEQEFEDDTPLEMHLPEK